MEQKPHQPRSGGIGKPRMKEIVTKLLVLQQRWSNNRISRVAAG
ncbi:MAG TPA: hypothetical protein VET69_06585 [Terriglobales bacterium]|nr:hypothetical protein [Terriglobales bacterium]